MQAVRTCAVDISTVMADWRTLRRRTPVLRWLTQSGQLFLVMIGLSSLIGAQAAPAAAKVTILPNCNFTGSSLSGSPIANVSSAQACGQLCEANSNCKVFTFTAGNCSLKSVPGPPDYSSNSTTSGVVDRGGKGDGCSLVANTAINSPGVPGYRINDLPSADVCCALCYAVPQCNAFAFSNTSTDGYRACFLKTQWDDNVLIGGNTDFFSGAIPFRAKVTLIARSNFTGSSLPGSPIPDVGSAQECGQLCDGNALCNVFTFKAGSCFLKSGPGAVDYSNANCTSGVVNRGLGANLVLANSTAFTTPNIPSYRFDFVGTVDACSVLCFFVPMCNAFAYNPFWRSCFLKYTWDRNPEYGLANSWVSGGVFRVPTYPADNNAMLAVNQSIYTYDGATRVPGIPLWTGRLFPDVCANVDVYQGFTCQTVQISGKTYKRVVNLNFDVQYMGQLYGSMAPAAQLTGLDIFSLLGLKVDPLPNSIFNKMPQLASVKLNSAAFASGFPKFHVYNKKLVYLSAINKEGTLKLKGRFPAGLFALPLRQLLLRGNSLEGYLPSIPATTPWKSSLTVLDLSYNNFRGPLPASWLALSKMQDLDFSFNRLNGNLPPPNPGARNTLILHNNRFSGRFPSLVKSPAFMIRLNDNNFGSRLHTQFSKTLSALFLGTNRIGGSLPSFKGFPNLQFLDLSTNLLVGKLDQSKIPAMTALILSNNRLSGGLPRGPLEVGYLDLSRNRFEGALPLGLKGKLHKGGLNVSHNQLTGPVPERDFFRNISVFADLSHNNLSGSIPPSLGSLGIQLDLSSNGLTGQLPAEFSQFSGKRLSLSNNKLSGPIPPNLMSKAQKAFLDLSKNGFTGAPPDFFAQPFNFLYVNVSNNKLSGKLPPSLLNGTETASTPYTADFTNNQLTGSLGATLSPFTLYLQGNFFSGRVPTRTGNGTLHRLVVRQNCLSGPPCSANCTSAPQRPSVQCNAFCGAGTATGSCSGQGTCSFDEAVGKYICTCISGYKRSSDGLRCLSA